jgi:alpha-amylase
MIVWISPVNQNYEGPRTAYGDPYHGYWIADATQLNEHFGTADDLKALSAELHRRNMWVSCLVPSARRPLQLTVLLRYLMVDIVVNDVMSTSTSPDYSQYMFKSSVRVSNYCTSGSNLGFSRFIIRIVRYSGETPLASRTAGLGT